MNVPDPVLDGVGITLVGSFNPKILQPMWFQAEGLVTKTDAENAEIEVIHPAIAAISIGPFRLRAVDEKFTAATDDAAAFPPLRDLVVGIFQLLRHTPARALGINRQMHFRATEDLSWDHVARTLEHAVPWSRALPGAEPFSMTLHGKRDSSIEGRLAVRFERSNRQENGIYVGTNDHYDVTPVNSAEGLEKIVELVRSDFLTSIDRSLDTAKNLVEVACSLKVN